MSVFLLIRHASPEYPEAALAGRLPGVELSARGREEAKALAASLGRLPLNAVYSSPRERARQTAAPLAESLALETSVEADFDEIDYGEWTGKTFAELDSLAQWKRYNSLRSAARIPGGEPFLDVQRRMVAGLERLRDRHPEGAAAIFTHGDPIRAAIAFYAGIPLDFVLRLEVGRGSVSMLSLTAEGVRIVCLNMTVEGPAGALQEQWRRA